MAYPRVPRVTPCAPKSRCPSQTAAAVDHPCIGTQGVRSRGKRELPSTPLYFSQNFPVRSNSSSMFRTYAPATFSASAWNPYRSSASTTIIWLGGQADGISPLQPGEFGMRTRVRDVGLAQVRTGRRTAGDAAPWPSHPSARRNARPHGPEPGKRPVRKTLRARHVVLKEETDGRVPAILADERSSGVRPV